MRHDHVPVHPPKVEVFDVDSGTNTDPKGFVRRVEEYRVEPYGLYMARAVVEHPYLTYMRSWLLPGPGVRVNEFCHRPGVVRDWDTYLDIVTVTTDGGTWRTVDHYLDIVLRTGCGLDVLDTDELAAALTAGLVNAATAHRALQQAFAAVEGLAANGYNVTRWLCGRGIPITWR